MVLRAALLAIVGFVVFGWWPWPSPENALLNHPSNPVKSALDISSSSLTPDQQNTRLLELEEQYLSRLYSELTKNLPADDLDGFASEEIGRSLVERRLKELSSAEILNYFNSLSPYRTMGSVRDRFFLSLVNKEFFERKDFQGLADLIKCTKMLDPQIRAAYNRGNGDVATMLEKLVNEDPAFARHVKVMLRGGGSQTPENITRTVGGDVQKFAALLASAELTSAPDSRNDRNRCISQFAADYPITAACNLDNFSPDDQKLIADRLNIWEILHSTDGASLEILSSSTNPYIAPKVLEMLAKMRGEPENIQPK
jgi:hypothetical protein